MAPSSSKPALEVADLSVSYGKAVALRGFSMTVAPGDTPFDQRFLEAMIPHHEAAVVMAQQALERSGRDEIRRLAQAIIATQQAEIDQMREWLRR